MRARQYGVVVALTLLSWSCARAPVREHDCSQEDAGVVVDTAVLAYLGEARALHHEASLDEEHEPALAVAALERLVHAPKPHVGRSIPEVEEVLADTYARIAELRVRLGELDKAALAAREGLTHAPDSSYFRGHLLEVSGLVDEARAAALRDAGKSAEADLARASAMRLLHEAVVVQEAVVKQSLADDERARKP
jgi:hypothetical protein